MKNLEKLNFKSLTRDELKSIKGGITCDQAATACSYLCPTLTCENYGGAWETCIVQHYGGIGCSPLYEAYEICGVC